MRKPFYILSVLSTLLLLSLTQLDSNFWWGFLVIGPIIFTGIKDVLQNKQSIRKNFPVVGRFRYIFESIRPEINQYFIESNSDGVPFSREMRSIVYQRAKKELDTLPFGTQKNVYDSGYEWATHSLSPKQVDPATLRVKVGGPACKQPYMASIFNVSAMSFGSLSKNAILALNTGAKLGKFAHNTGEGGLSPYHLQPGGDLIWQIGTGYFSCRTSDGRFSEAQFREKAILPQVKMIEVKLSQGAKPSHGGILPAAKVTEEIAEIRGVEMGKDVLSPAAHTAFTTPIEFMHFLKKLRNLSDGKPIGFKLCLGKKHEFIALCKAMLKTGFTPDFITVDGGEGGTGAAPLEFSNSVGYPLREALVFVHGALVGFNLRHRIKIIASGKIVNAFDLISKFALGADMCNSARAMMMALGCIQALRCNTNKCPTGVATQNPGLVKGLHVQEKSIRVFNYHQETLRETAEFLGAMGLTHVYEVSPQHIVRRTGVSKTKTFLELYDYLYPGQLLHTPIPPSYQEAMESSQAESFAPVITALESAA